jgi:hypothetical protein
MASKSTQPEGTRLTEVEVAAVVEGRVVVDGGVIVDVDVATVEGVSVVVVEDSATTDVVAPSVVSRDVPDSPHPASGTTESRTAMWVSELFMPASRRVQCAPAQRGR